MLITTDLGPNLVFYNESNDVRASLGVDLIGTRLILLDDNSKPRAELEVTYKGPNQTLRDENGRVIWKAIKSEGTP